jgi:hypothetical protein
LPAETLYAVPAVTEYVAFATVPLTLAPATAFAVVAYVAKLTAPLTLAPATESAEPAVIA